MLQTGMRGLIWAIAQSGVVAVALAIGLAEGTIAQIVPDETLGAERSQVTAAGDRIEGGAQRGQNLFHSFREFNVGTGQQVYFANPADVRNIFSRVTGTNISNIDGVLGVDGSANLFLMNPNGIVFGRNARLDVGGSFVGTTANAIGFGDRGWFGATSPENASPLLVISPSALQFSSQLATPSQILVQGDGSGTRRNTDLIDTQMGLRVASDRTLALLGGNVTLTGATLKTAGGRIEIGSVAAPNIVSLNPVADGWAFNYAEVEKFGDIQLSQQSTVDTSGLGGGNIRIQGRRISLASGSQIESSTLGDESRGALEVVGSESVELNSLGSNLLTGLITDVYAGATGSAGNLTVTTGRLSGNGNLVQISNSTEGYSQGNAGNLTINTGTLNLQDGAQILTSTSSTGNGGNLAIYASGSINLKGGGANNLVTGLFAQVGAGATGSGGNLAIETRNLNITDGSTVNVSTYSTGNSGDLTVRASNTINLNSSSTDYYLTGLFSQSAQNETGNGGNLSIATNNLNLTGENTRINSSTSGNGRAGNLTIDANRIHMAEGQILASTFGAGNGGNLLVDSSDSIELDGLGTESTTGFFTQVEPGAIGLGGNLSIETGRLSITNGARVSSSTFGVGDGGELTIWASDVININGLGTNLSRTGLLTESREGEAGSGGDLLIETRNLNVINRGQVSTSTFGAGNAGNLIIQASRDINLRGSDTGLFTEASTGATGAGGDLTLRARDVVISNGAGISLDTYGRGNAGDLKINVRDIIARGSQVTTSTDGAGNAGSIVIRASNFIDLSGEFSNTRNGAGSPGGLLAQVGALTATGHGGNLTIDTRRLRISDGSKVQVTTFGRGNAGVLRIQADEIDVFDTSRPNRYSTGILAGTGNDPIVNRETPARGNGGRLIINTNRLSIRGGEVSSDTRGLGNAGTARIRSRDLIEVIDPVAASGRRSFLSARSLEGARGNAGDLIVDARRLVVRGGQVTASSSDRGQAGNLIIRATDSIDLSGVSSRRVQINAVDGRIVLPEQPGTVSAQVDRTGTRPGGNLTLQTNRLTVSDRAQISVSNQGTARAGDLSINSRLVQLSDRAQLSAETRNANGGNITFNANDALLMDDRSSITTNAGTARAGGNGGNIVLNAGFVIANPNTANQISANAFRGNGGQVNITTQGIYGFNDTDQPNLNTITATSNSGVQGTVTLNTPNIDPARGLTELPTAPIDATRQIASTCPTNTQEADRLGSFIVSGRGGLPPSPTDLLSNDNILSEWVTPGESGHVQAASPAPSQAIVEAQGWVRDAQGKVRLVAASAPAAIAPASCPQP